MFGVKDFVLGGLAPMAAAAAAYAVAWRIWRRSGAAWSCGVVVGYAGGVLALEARDVKLSAAAQRLVRASESHDWLAALALVSVLPMAAAAITGRRRVEWALAAPLCFAVPLVLLWGKYRASQALRDAGFADNAISQPEAAALLVALAAAMLVAMALWNAAPKEGLPRTRALLAVAGATGAAAAAALTGALVYAQALGVVAASLGGCTVMAWLVRDGHGPEASRGPVIVLLSGLLAVAAVYSSLRPWQAVTLAIGLVLPIGWLPFVSRRPIAVQILIRLALLGVPSGFVLWSAGSEFIANEQRQGSAPNDPGAAEYDYFGP